MKSHKAKLSLYEVAEINKYYKYQRALRKAQQKVRKQFDMQLKGEKRELLFYK